MCHDGMPGWGMGNGWIAALVKYLFFDNRRK